MKEYKVADQSNITARIERMRAGHEGNFNNFIDWLQGLDDCKLVEHGTSQEELSDLRRQLNIREAQEALETIRSWLSGPNPNPDRYYFGKYLLVVEDHLKAGKLTPEDIGSTESEMNDLRRRRVEMRGR